MMNMKELKQAVLSGKIFIYPTDTIYGLGCDALNKESVEKIREIKKRDEKPFSVIAPTVGWIKDNCIVDVDLSKYLPGKYTLVLKKRNRELLQWVSEDTIGVRIPDCEFTRKIQKIGVPFITTSVNFSGKKPATCIEEIDKEILKKADFVINEGKLNGKSSTLVINGKEVER